MNELGLVQKLDRVASVSGGSIASAALAVGWKDLNFKNGVADNFVDVVAKPILALTAKTIDVWAILLGFIPGIKAGDRVAKAYNKYICKDATLQQLEDQPRFIFHAANLMTGGLWRFSKFYAAEYRVGQIKNPEFPLAKVVAASAAFPPLLSPVDFKFAEGEVEPLEGADLHKPPYTRKAVLTDGGVYANLGVESIWKRCDTIFVSNAGRNTRPDPSPPRFWPTQIYRVLNIIHGQGDNMRERQVVGLLKSDSRKGAFWTIDSKIDSGAVAGSITFSDGDIYEASHMRTRLNHFSGAEQRLLINYGYALADARIRKYYKLAAAAAPPSGLPDLP